ncbi:MAG: anhydro-N-acetylmuramic acid kinase [Burkholderiales bacterium]|nr:anhydro-N-acetylmuramic acid kinase [Phycisphaerae bacterium]
MQERLLIGAMSGTSADGVDTALVRITGTGLAMRATLLHLVEHAYPPALRERIFAARQAGAIALADLASLAADISDSYAHAVMRVLSDTSTAASSVSAIAAHGQTLYHAPPLTIQWIDPALLAYRTGIDVISDFRRADCAAGGQGAPLVPFADYILFRDEKRNRVILNIGGISNVTILPAGCTLEQVTGFDTGPGNCISDWLMRDHGGVDIDGKIALGGRVNTERVNRLMIRPYFHAPYPKSTDGPFMLDLWQRSINPDIQPESLADQLATAAHWVSNSIHMGILQATQGQPCEIIAAGGGTRNPAIMRRLSRQHLYGQVKTTDDLGIPTQSREAIAFAILGAATLDRFPANVVSVTGAKENVILGSITPAATTFKT